MSVNDGGPAFPKINGTHTSVTGDQEHYGADGVSAREWFAGFAMQAIIGNNEFHIGKKQTAELAYQYADHMLAERERGGMSDGVKAKALIVVRGGCAYVHTTEDVEWAIVDIDNIKAGDDCATLPAGVGYEELVKQADVADFVTFEKEGP